MDPRQGPAKPRPQSLSGAAAEMDRRRAFLQNFTPAFNIGPQAPRVRLANAEASRPNRALATSYSMLSSSSSSRSESPAKGMTYATTLQGARYLDRRTQGYQDLTIGPGDDYEDELEDDSEPGFDGEEIDEGVGPVELEGVDIDEVEDIQAEDMEALDDEEDEDEGIRRYDEYMYDDEEFEEGEFDESMASTSFDPMQLAGLNVPTSSSTAQLRISSQYNEPSRVSEGRGQTRQIQPEGWEDDSDDEEFEAENQPSIRQFGSTPTQGDPEQAYWKSAKVKPIISPDICDGMGGRSAAIKTLDVPVIDEADAEIDDSDVEEILQPARPTPKRVKNRGAKARQIPVLAVKPNRICLSFTHESSSSPEKKPRYTIAPSHEDSNDVDSNDEDDPIHALSFDTPKTSRPTKESLQKKAGRPRKQVREQQENDDDDSRNLESADDSRTPSGDGARRTKRTRKPTKPFVINFGGRSSSCSLSPRKGFREDKDADENSDKEKRLTMTFKNIGDAVARGTGSGRTRGRPKGSTTKFRTHATACLENIAQEVLSKTSTDVGLRSEPVSDEDVEAETPAKGAKKSSRGGRPVKTPKTTKDKNKRVSKAKPAEILDENAMMGYAKLRGDFDDSVDGESFKLGDDDTRFSNGNFSTNSPANSNMDSITPKIKKTKNSEAYLEESKPVTAETLFDYWWTRDGKSERFLLQEQISEFLGVTSFKRKYPDLKRRLVDMEERIFLRRQKIVTEVECVLGLTALKFDDVIPILRTDFHSKYLELEEVWSQRMEAELERKKAEVKPVERAPLKMKPEDIRKALIRSTAEWNAALNKDRRANRSRAMDLQTFTIHEQIGRTQKFIMPPEMTKTGYFPVPALVGQYVDAARVPKFSADDLKYMPLNTPVYGPVTYLNSADGSEDSESDSDASTSTDDTSSSSDITGKQEPSSDTDDNASGTDNCTPLVVGGEGNLGGPDAMNVICKSCSGGIMNNKDAVPEMIIHCTKCKVPNHPTCLELSQDMLPHILKYNWQCTDCKNCIECNDPADEDKMLFCDLCDRGYHIYCVGLRKVPTGRWHCRVCAICYSCGAKAPSEEDRLAEWYHEFKKMDKNSKFYLHSQCVNCHKLYKKGLYCPCCLKVHLKFDKSDKSLIECRTCEKWVHTECAKSKPVSSGTMFGFRCDSCEAAFKIRTKIRTAVPFGVCP